MDRAACRAAAVDPDLFFPVSESGLSTQQVADVKAVCARCPVTADCLSWALREEPAGIWGGTTPEERRRLRRARRPAHAPTLV
jgi:WhiB family redox-sensing transcriptional regulator